MIVNYQRFKEAIISLVNNSGLDIGAVYYIFKDLYKDIEQTYYMQINRELAVEKEQENNKNDDVEEN